MCTVAWEYISTDGAHTDLQIYFNRDEQRTRSKALPPQIFTADTGDYTLPVDPQSQGSWIAAHSNGYVVALLNDYSVDLTPLKGLKLTSRGQLVKQSIELADFTAIDTLVRTFTSDHHIPPFTLLCWENGSTHRWHWNLTKLSYSTDNKPPITSSSWDTPRVERMRRNLFQTWVTESENSLYSYNSHQFKGDKESSVCMSRELTQTVSLTHIKVSATHVSMEYAERDGEDAFKMFTPETSHTLSRTQSIS